MQDLLALFLRCTQTAGSMPSASVYLVPLAKRHKTEFHFSFACWELPCTSIRCFGINQHFQSCDRTRCCDFWNAVQVGRGGH